AQASASACCVGLDTGWRPWVTERVHSLRGLLLRRLWLPLLVLLLCSALLVASAVAISGIIGFIGLVVPHLMRMWLGPDHRGLVPGSLLCGAMLLLLADTLARTVAAPAEMPVGLLTSVLGAPWFLWLIFRREKGTHG
ncbi:MAG: iron chelate uptake ABC transporter family permease subunit, partial [Klebsiella sp.]|nr:iron chelate uptake ABC transporter family permease subunit [Klebsiella sp.]